MLNIYKSYFANKFVFSFLSNFLKTLCSFLFIFVLSTKFDENTVNTWLIITTIYSLGMFFDSGFGITLMRYISNTYHKKNNQEYIETYLIFKNIFLVILTIVLFVFIPLVSYFYLKDHENFFLLSFYLLGILLIYFINQFLFNLLSGFQRNIQAFFNEIITCVYLLFSIILFLFFNPYIWMAYVLFLSSQLILLILNYKTYKLSLSKFFNKNFKFSATVEKYKNIFKDIFKQGSGVVIYKLFFYFMLLDYCKSLSIEQSMSLLFSFKLLQALSVFIFSLNYAIIPEITNKISRKGKFDHKRFINLLLICLTVFISIIILFYYFLNDIFILLDSNLRIENNIIWFIVAFAFLLERFGGIFLQLISSFGNVVIHKVNTISIFTVLYLYYNSVLTFPYAFLLSLLFVYMPLIMFYLVKIYKRNEEI